MKTIDRYLCCQCAQNLQHALLVYKEIPNTKGDKDKCDWCRKVRYGTMYRIQYGKEENDG